MATLNRLLMEADQNQMPARIFTDSGLAFIGLVSYDAEEQDATVCVSTGYRHYEDRGFVADPDIPPIHIAVAHVAAFRYED